MDVRAHTERPDGVVGTGAPAHDVPCSVDGHVEFRCPHQSRHIRATFQVGIAVGDATHASLWVLANLGERLQMRVQSRAVDAECGLPRPETE
jgi:hypothetical protein